jgi:hypothetical protein
MIGVSKTFFLLLYVFSNDNYFPSSHTSDAGRILRKAKNDFIDLRLPCPASMWETCRVFVVVPRPLATSRVSEGVVASPVAPLQASLNLIAYIALRVLVEERRSIY